MSEDVPTTTSTAVSNNNNDNDSDDESDVYVDQSTNDLGVISGAALITADCMGTGILALPADMKTLGLGFGIFFILLNLPINLYAGTVLSKAAAYVEGRLEEDDATDENDDENGVTTGNGANKGYDSLQSNTDETLTPQESRPTAEELYQGTSSASDGQNAHGHQQHGEVHTYDFIGMSTALFDAPHTMPPPLPGQQVLPSQNADKKKKKKTTLSLFTRATILMYYINIFLVLGNYILVMSHAVAAMIGEDRICLPVAGLIASLLMFAVSQLRTMANLGRTASVISLLALFIVVVLCISSVERGTVPHSNNHSDGSNSTNTTNTGEESNFEESLLQPEVFDEGFDFNLLLRQLAAVSSVGFAVGSQKLLLNIRHEMAVREKCAPKALSISLIVFGAAYILVCLLSGPDPPSFLFDAIGDGTGRHVAGFLLWVHVAVSFAINSQALCSSIDRIHFHRVTAFNLQEKHRTRWLLLTLLVGFSSYTVANAIPFFKDLVALIGALTSVPLTLLMPAIFHRRVMQVPIFKLGKNCDRYDVASYLLLLFSTVFLVVGLFGALGSIELDWAHHGPPFACW